MLSVFTDASRRGTPNEGCFVELSAARRKSLQVFYQAHQLEVENVAARVPLLEAVESCGRLVKLPSATEREGQNRPFAGAFWQGRNGEVHVLISDFQYGY